MLCDTSPDWCLMMFKNGITDSLLGALRLVYFLPEFRFFTTQNFNFRPNSYNFRLSTKLSGVPVMQQFPS